MNEDALMTQAHNVIEDCSVLIGEIPEEDGFKSLSWSHSKDCPGIRNPAGTCNCNQAIMNENQFNHFESSLHTEYPDQSNDLVSVKLENRPALTFLSRWLGVVKGKQAKCSTVRSDVQSPCNPNYSDAALLATSTQHRVVGNTNRAVFGVHGFVSKTLRRCFELIKRMIFVIQCFMQGSGVSFPVCGSGAAPGVI